MEENASNKLTMELHRNWNYNGGVLAYTRNLIDPDTGEIFFLRAFLNDPNRLGQCNDFADFLVCLMTSLGIPRSAQRTHSLLDSRREVTLPNGHTGRLFFIHNLAVGCC